MILSFRSARVTWFCLISHIFAEEKVPTETISVLVRSFISSCKTFWICGGKKLDVFQYLGVTVKEVYKCHVVWFGSQTEPPDYLITKVCALGYGLEKILHSCVGAFFCQLVARVLGSAQVPLGDCYSLEVVSEKVKLHGDEILLFFVVLSPVGESFFLKLGVVYINA